MRGGGGLTLFETLPVRRGAATDRRKRWGNLRWGHYLDRDPEQGSSPRSEPPLLYWCEGRLKKANVPCRSKASSLPLIWVLHHHHLRSPISTPDLQCRRVKDEQEAEWGPPANCWPRCETLGTQCFEPKKKAPPQKIICVQRSLLWHSDTGT